MRIMTIKVTTKKRAKTTKSFPLQSGKSARSLTISSDGTALFVVNFVSDTMSKVRTTDIKVIHNIKVCDEPIAITHESPTSRTWVACYGGAIKIFDNK